MERNLRHTVFGVQGALHLHEPAACIRSCAIRRANPGATAQSRQACLPAPPPLAHKQSLWHKAPARTPNGRRSGSRASLRASEQAREVTQGSHSPRPPWAERAGRQGATERSKR